MFSIYTMTSMKGLQSELKGHKTDGDYSVEITSSIDFSSFNSFSLRLVISVF